MTAGSNPPYWVEWGDEPVPGYPMRPVPRDEDAGRALERRTLTNLYEARPQWLADAHDTLDVAVAAAYGWRVDISEDDVQREAYLRDLGNAPGNVQHWSRRSIVRFLAEGLRIAPIGLNRFAVDGGSTHRH